ncbi:hypothetical protein CS022_24425 [Veronia nyctiphanis]|uniref:Uncharacterized protein n=1 Tax=Veronia nyctiphanis TaxID=1278244 RepID=A0A4Q0YE74_9GAMM|nr:hypothetical protein [Veronia nyctiphanis]RXJ67201.1 hypothetical protein CS022_24425 [Veronia nyctiphanis]
MSPSHNKAIKHRALRALDSQNTLAVYGCVSQQGGIIKMYHHELTGLLSEVSEKIYEFQLTGYSFEEWFNWELYAKFKQSGYSVTPKPAFDSQYKSYADLLVQDPKTEMSVYIEVKLVHDDTSNKWLNEIEVDRKALQLMKNKGKCKGLQLLLLTSSHKDLLNHPNWKPWLEKLSFWSIEPDVKTVSKHSEGSIIILGWDVG